MTTMRQRAASRAEDMSRVALLAQLTEEARASLALLYRNPVWVRPSETDLDVAIIGGGQSGVGIAFALNRAGIERVAVFEAAPQDRVGVWATTARMEALRTDKSISGLDQGIPELSFPRWLDRLEGQGAFERLVRIPRLVWAEYVGWLTGVFACDIRYESSLIDVRPAEGGLGMTFSGKHGEKRLTARRLVLATGLDGFGAPFIPETVARVVPKAQFSHTAEDIDFAALQGRRVIVLGAAASAFDAAATALEAGASQVHLLARSAQLATVPSGALAKNPALYRPFRDFPDALRWKIITEGRARGHAPPATIDRAQRHANFHLHQGVSAETLRFQDGEIRADLLSGPLAADYLIAGTGYATDVKRRPELALVEPHLRLWRDVLGAPAADSEWGRFPYLDPDLALQTRSAADDWITRIHAFNYAAVLSHGYHVGDIGSHVDCVSRLTEGLASRLFAEEADYHLAAAGHASPVGSGSSISPPVQPSGAQRCARSA
nr:NAD(P)/FAD-dependent oxidoreductase [Rhizobium rhizogenes]